jgi:hypothetical protein
MGDVTTPSIPVPLSHIRWLMTASSDQSFGMCSFSGAVRRLPSVVGPRLTGSGVHSQPFADSGAWYSAPPVIISSPAVDIQRDR